MAFYFKSIKRLTILLALGLGLIVSSFAHANSKIILVYGDSLSAGYGISKSEAWPSLLQTKLTGEKIYANVINASVSGETTSGGLSRFEQTLRQQQPTSVILALGANDGLRGLPIKSMQKNLQAMIDLAKQYHCNILLVGMKIPSNYGRHYTHAFLNAFEALSEKNKIPLVPFLLKGVWHEQEMMQNDQLHPNAKGQPLLLANVWPALRKLITQ